MNAKFKRDLKKGQKYERLATEYFDYRSVHFPKGKFSDYDFILDNKLKIEVKSDIIASTTGNLAIEYKCNGKPSGLHTTKSDFYVYFICHADKEDEAFKIPTEELKSLCRKNGRKVSGGDRNASRMYLLHRDHIIKYLISEKVHGPIYNMTEETKQELSYTDQLILKLEAMNFDNIDSIKQCVNDFRGEQAEKFKKEKEDRPADIIPFGKYKGKKVDEVAKFDKKYLQWVYKQEWFNKFDDLKPLVQKLI